MKRIAQTLTYLLILTFNFSNLQAAAVELLFEETTQAKLLLERNPSEPRRLCREIKIENIGNEVVGNFFPYTNDAPCFSLEMLAKKLAGHEQPLLAIYHLWYQSVLQDENSQTVNCHPLDLINFKGTCSKETFSLQFIHLCNALGIETRLANIHGKERYDFSFRRGVELLKCRGPSALLKFR